MVATIREFHTSSDDLIRHEVFGAGRPAVLRGFVQAWPAVTLGSPQALVEYLRRLDSGSPVDAVMTPPEVRGRIFYDGAMQGFNFIRNRLPITTIAEQVLRYSVSDQAPAVAAQSALIRDCLPGFARENALTVLNEAILPRIWLGNAITTPTHLDEWNNIGCVVSGRRRFTLLPPQQVANLYIGPLDFAPTGAPMSLVSLHEPDLRRFPKFREALAAAQSAELGPGDAIYIPPLWWHHVESLERFNVLVNYWWDASSDGRTTESNGSGFDVLIHALLNLHALPPATREAWQALFDHFVFGPQSDVTGHIPPHRHGVLGSLSPEDRARLRAYLKERF